MEVTSVGDADNSHTGAVFGRYNDMSSPVSNVYWATDATSQGVAGGTDSISGVTGLTTEEMTGDSAETQLDGFDWSIWTTTSSTTPELAWESN